MGRAAQHFSLRLNKPDEELEMLPGTWTPPEHALLQLAEENSLQPTETDEGNDDGTINSKKRAEADDNTEEEDAEDTEDAADAADDPLLAAIHVGRRVPVYRKLGEFRSNDCAKLCTPCLSLCQTKRSRKHCRKTYACANI
jgi:hypothetical protein